MKVLHFIPFYKPAWKYGGPAISVSQLCEGLVSHGIDVNVFTTNANGMSNLEVPTNKLVMVDGVPVRYFKRIKTPWGIDSLDLRREIDNAVANYDLVHVSTVWQPLGIAVCNAAIKAGIPYVSSLRGTINEWAWKQRKIKHKIFWHLFQKRLLQKASALHFTCRKELEDMHNIGIEFSNKAIIVPNPIKPFEFTRNEQAAKDFRKNLDIPEGEKIILFLGRIHPKKGLDLFLKSVYPILLEEKDWIFVIVGPDEKKHQKKLKKLVECLGIKDKVIFHGAVYDKLKIGAYSAADIFVLTSYNENFGMSVVEAMAFGIPVIISDQVGISREIAEDRAGVVVPLNEKVIHDSLLDLVNNEGLRQQYSISGIECVRKRYNVDTVCSQMIKNYESIINSGK